jgi:hypothetical protein
MSKKKASQRSNESPKQLGKAESLTSSSEDEKDDGRCIYVKNKPCNHFKNKEGEFEDYCEQHQSQGWYNEQIEMGLKVCSNFIRKGLKHIVKPIKGIEDPHKTCVECRQKENNTKGKKLTNVNKECEEYNDEHESTKMCNARYCKDRVQKVKFFTNDYDKVLKKCAGCREKERISKKKYKEKSSSTNSDDSMD